MGLDLETRSLGIEDIVGLVVPAGSPACQLIGIRGVRRPK